MDCIVLFEIEAMNEKVLDKNNYPFSPDYTYSTSFYIKNNPIFVFGNTQTIYLINFGERS